MKIRKITTGQHPKHFKRRFEVQRDHIGTSTEKGRKLIHEATTFWLGRRYVNVYTTHKTKN